ncbi:hypothetical protein, partial [Pantoea agglomerans]|uniref:hypothetical protein n=1 Tax=Enterobacter agglomerans TaxID=549 RepID=UPI00203294B1
VTRTALYFPGKITLKLILCYEDVTYSSIKPTTAIVKGFPATGDNQLALSAPIIDEPGTPRRVLNANGPAFSPPFIHTRKR